MIIRELGLQPYAEIFSAMKDFTEGRRTTACPDELWLLEHEPVFTQGLAGKDEHVLRRGAIPIVPIDRGGQITYHGPGQLVMYLLLDLRRSQVGIRALVSMLENSVINLLRRWHIDAVARPDAPGVYVAGQKIASLGLKIRHGCSYHGLALNVDMDLSPFSWINPCGLKQMTMTQLKDLGVNISVVEAGRLLSQEFIKLYGEH